MNGNGEPPVNLMLTGPSPGRVRAFTMSFSLLQRLAILCGAKLVMLFPLGAPDPLATVVRRGLPAEQEPMVHG